MGEALSWGTLFWGWRRQFKTSEMSDSVDMTFVTLDVGGGTWLEWGSSITDVTDMANQAIAKLGPGECIGRLIICTHGAPGGAFLGFDGTGAGVEVIHGAEINPTVRAQLKRLRPYFCPDGVIEIRCCLFGAGDKGKQALQAIADLTGVAVTAPEDSILAVMGLGGISITWATAYPYGFGVPPTSSFWRGYGIEQAPAGATASAGAAAAAAVAVPRYLPMPGLPAPAPPGPAVVPPEVLSALPSVSSSNPNAGYKGFDQLGWALVSHEEPDTPPPPTEYHFEPREYALEQPPTGPPPPTHYDFSSPPLQPVPTTGGLVDSSYGLQPAPSSIFDAAPNGFLAAVGDFLTGRIGCLTIAGALIALSLGGLLWSNGFFGGGHSSTAHTSTAPGVIAAASSRPNPAFCAGQAKLIIDQFYPDVVQGGNGTAPTFSTGGKKYCLTHLATYHWNGGKGDPPLTAPNPSPTPSGGTLSILSAGKVIGTWQATSTPGTGGALVNWEADIPTTSPVILDGTYEVGDSHPATWSWSKASNHMGFIRVWAIEYTGP